MKSPPGRPRWFYRTSKRTLDLTASFLALMILSPVLITLAVMIHLKMGSPVFYRQTRGGHRGKPFTYLKFRTMTERRNPDGSLLPDDERITPLGHFLRKTTLDELPSLINVLRNQMSLVGPRPLYYHYVPLYSETQRRRLDVKPGLTGWAIIHGRNSLSWERRFELDVWYVDNRSFWLDIRIIAKTILIVLLRKGVNHPGSATMHEFRGSANEQ